MANYYKERYEFIERLFQMLGTISPEKIIGQYIELSRRGRHFMGLCPFHGDTKLGSFLVTPDKGIWKCFACGDEFAGNAVKFVSLYKNKGYLDAAFDIALQMGLITHEEFDKYSRKKYDENFVQKLEKRYSDKVKNAPKPVIAKPDIIHNVYYAMKQVCPLTEEHRKCLLEDRHLTEERIDKDYFTCPINWKQKDNVITSIKKMMPNLTDDALKTVPGFFFDKKRNKISFAGYRGICILIRNAEGFISAIQIRKDTAKDGESRYVWFSSAFAFYKPEEFSGGCGCGSQKDVMWASGNKKILCITEGRFKSEALCKHENNCISVQGVSSWNGIINTIGDIKRKKEIESIYLFFDADILGKRALFAQSEKMCIAINEAFPDIRIKYAFWSKKEGKGIDDYIYSGSSLAKINYIDWKQAASEAVKQFQNVLNEFHIKKMQELERSKIMSFEERLQTLLEEKFVK